MVSLMVFFALLSSGAATAAAPVALAGRPFLAYPGDLIELNGSESADPDGDAITAWAWSQVGGPAVALEATGGPRPRFQVEEPGTYSIELVVGAGGETSAPDVVDIIVVAPDAGSRYQAEAGGCATPVGAGGLVGLFLGLFALIPRRRR